VDYDVRTLRSAAAESPDLVYTPFSEAEISVPPSPRFVFGECTQELMARYYRENYTAPVGLYTASNVGVFGEALLIHGNTMLACDELEMTVGDLAAYRARYQAARGLLRPRMEAGQCVLLLGRGFGIYGHWLVDFLPKLFLLHQAGHDLMRLRYLVPRNAPKFGIDLLELLGITAEKRIAYHPDFELLCADQLLVPTMARSSSRTSSLFRQAVEFVTALIWRRNARPLVAGDTQRIFISRGRAGRPARNLLNRQQIERTAGAAGFRIVHPEQMSLLDQFAMFDNARQIVGEYGSALHAAIFARPGATVCALRGTGSEIAGFLQSGIGAALDLPTGYVFGPTIAGDRRDSFSVSEAALQSCIDLIFSGTPLA
jgi:capsular polysaccharide biosynthesis protein